MLFQGVMNMSKSKKISLFLLLPVTIIVIAIFILFSYLIVIPKIVSSQMFWDVVQKCLSTTCDAELIVYRPFLKTSTNAKITFMADNFFLSKNGNTLLSIQNFDLDCDLSKILKKKFILDRLGADEIYIDVNKLSTLKIKGSNNNQNQNSDISIDWFNSVFYIKRCAIIYRSPQDALIKFLAGNIIISQDTEPKLVKFGALVDLDYKNEKLRLILKDNDNVYIKDHKLFIDDFKLRINNSEIYINAEADNDNHFDLKLTSDKFEIANVEKFINTNMLIPNGQEIMSCFKDLSGDFNFNFHITEKNIDSTINVNKIEAKLIPLADIPLTVNKGSITIDEKNIYLKDFEGFYGSDKKNNIVNMYGTVKNYPKTADSELILTGTAYDELAKYISKLAGVRINLIKNSNFALKILFDITGKVDVKGGAKIPQGSDILFEGASISPNKFDRAMGIDLTVLGEDLFINHINYYISEFIAEDVKPQKPLVTIKGITNAFTGFIKELEFDIPEPLPSEFFNILVGQKIFKNGTFSGNMKFVNAEIPKLYGNMNLDAVRIVGQRFLIKKASINSDENFINVSSNGIFRRTKYDFSGKMQNKILFPIVIDNIKLNLDEVNVEKILKTFAPRPENAPPRPQRPKTNENNNVAPKSDVPLKYFEISDNQPAQSTEETSEQGDAEPIEFMPNILIIKECGLNIEKGSYKEINFGNLHANMTLTKDGVLEIKSNKFDFAEGISTLKVYCDLLKQTYSIRLGAKDVNIDAISTSILNLSREISGKASALLEFNTDKTAKLNGKIQFALNNGSITKLGLVQYALNAASLFRNPLAMISPSTLFDLVNIPDGTFNKINGTLIIKNNIIEKMMIKSASPQLSAFIIGRLNLESMDTSLRIYTKFSNKNKGIEGFLRGLSLNAIARKTSSNARDDISYYAAELSQLPKLEIGEETSQVFLTKIDGDIQTTNYLSSLKKIK